MAATEDPEGVNEWLALTLFLSDKSRGAAEAEGANRAGSLSRARVLPRRATLIDFTRTEVVMDRYKPWTDLLEFSSIARVKGPRACSGALDLSMMVR